MHPLLKYAHHLGRLAAHDDFSKQALNGPLMNMPPGLAGPPGIAKGAPALMPPHDPTQQSNPLGMAKGPMSHDILGGSMGKGYSATAPINPAMNNPATRMFRGEDWMKQRFDKSQSPVPQQQPGTAKPAPPPPLAMRPVGGTYVIDRRQPPQPGSQMPILGGARTQEK